MNAINQTMYEQLQIRIPREPCTYLMAAGASKMTYSDSENKITFHVKGDKFSGIVSVQYNYGRDSYDIEFYSKKGESLDRLADVYGDELSSVLWHRTFIV